MENRQKVFNEKLLIILKKEEESNDKFYDSIITILHVDTWNACYTLLQF